MKFARVVFLVAGVYGIVTLLPTYFLESLIGVREPPPITHPEYFYGFLGVALAWQVLFIVIASNPVRLRPAMPVALLEKLGFGAAAIALFVAQRASAQVLSLGLVDLLLGGLFAAAHFVTPHVSMPMHGSETRTPVRQRARGLQDRAD